MAAVILISMILFGKQPQAQKALVIKSDSIKFIEVKIDGKTYYLDTKNITE